MIVTASRWITWSLVSLCVTVWLFVVPMRAFADDPPAPAAISGLCEGASDSGDVLVQFLAARGPAFLSWSGTTAAQDGTDDGAEWLALLGAASAYWGIQACVAQQAAAGHAHLDAQAVLGKLDQVHDDSAALLAKLSDLEVVQQATVDAVEAIPPATGGGAGAVAALQIVRQDMWYVVGLAVALAVMVAFWQVMRP